MHNHKECLLIDDDPDDQEIFMICINAVDASTNCRSVDNGVTALEMLRSNAEYVPDYIFIDVNMHRMNGIECLKALRQIDRLTDTKMYMYSTTSEVSVVAESKKLGAQDFIIKPAKTTELQNKLSKILEIT